VVSNAIVTAKHCRSDQAKQLLCSLVEGAIFVGLRVEGKKPLDSQVVASKQFFIHFRPVTVEFIHWRCPFASDPKLEDLVS
jgi:hypothetical protein